MALQMMSLSARLPKIKFRRGSGPKEWLLFGLSLICAGFFAWFGFRFIAFGDTVSSQELFLLGVAQVIGGIIISGSEHHWSIGFSVVAIGFYSFARSAGIIKLPILGYVIALASWAAGVLLLYITYPQPRKPAQQ
jgi:hypothetical protein